jgi:mono/diheme cytochrome c family protein
MRPRSITVAAFVLLGCRDPLPASPPPTPVDTAVAAPAWSDGWLLEEGRRYLDDPAHRRRSLEASLTRHDNSYARQRLDHYALNTTGWDLLPPWNPVSVPVTDAPAAPLDGVAALWDGQRPGTLRGWVELGRAVFFRYPLREEVFLEHALRRPDFARSVGIVRAPDGTYPGAVRFRDIDGESKVGLTCALCHTDLRDGALVVGRARRSFDYGRMRLAYHADTGAPVDPELARRMRAWGPGRADVTEDRDEDPVAIPDLWGLREQQYLTQAGTLRHIGPAALAIRQETQLLHSNHERVRPPRELAWALAMYLYSLRAPERPAGDPALVAQGGRLFHEQCRECHSNAAGGGPLVAASRVGTDPALATGHGRGTGRYRPAALLAVAEAGPYLHDGSLATLEDLFGAARFSPSYRGVNGVGAVPGHPWGTDWRSDDRAALLAWLRSR